MLRARGKRTPPLLMILVLIAAVTPLPLKAWGVNINFTPTLCSLIHTYGRAVSFISWAYQPALVSELSALTNELPGEQTNPEATPSCDQIACNQERITIEDWVIERPLPTTELELQPMSQIEPLGMAAPRLVRVARKAPAATLRTLSAEPIIRIALVQEADIPSRINVRNDIGRASEMRFAVRPALLTQSVNSIPRQVKVALSELRKDAIVADLEAVSVETILRYTQKLESMKANCNFKGVKVLQKKMAQEEEAVKVEKKTARSQAKADSEIVEPATLPEFMYSEF